ncbi:hypothetical protein GT037_000039 [Alternaria burnsii]|uniref:Heterokaryon incompatibility domain-containing protein n=1 Tax=Alternaria burnsii TaxID=1187904 RepID=A0A8H7BGB8_9PLEO|nr:uncharacterized protein GT037_000039 [Alternaria burnsii]KAF7681063.1 hypothetical protein GT037_000039 [Alternaria burnsii]
MPDLEPPSEGSVSELMRKRVQSFTTEPLHSAAYLNDVVRYLGDKPPASARYRVPSPTPKESNFLYAYKIPESRLPQAISYSQASDFLTKNVNQADLDLLFFTGSPSSEWMEVLVDRLHVDVRFLHSHLDFIPNAQRDWHTGSNLPSRNRQDFRLLIPSIVFVGTEGNSLSVDQLHAARRSCASQLEKRANVLLSGGAKPHGQSIFRQVNVHRGDAIVVEQIISIAVTGIGKARKVIVWSDAGADAGDIPIPDTPDFKGHSPIPKPGNTSKTIEHCPIFFERDMSQSFGLQTAVDQNDNSRSTLQPLAVLPSRYGETMDWTTTRADPLLMLQELFYFQTAAACQYLDMLRKLISGWTAQLHPTGDSDPTMEFIIHFEYTKTVLVRWSTHFDMLLLRLEDHLSHDPELTPEQRRLRQTSFSPIKKDIEYLQKEAETLINLCESGKATIMSSFSVYASKRAQKESSLVTQLTKTTNRITLIFLPISLVTSVFGMNFKQLGQGPLSITLWAAVTSSAASVIIVPGVSADALDKHTCYHFEELMKNWCAAPNVWVYDHGVHLDTPQSWNPFCDCGEDLLSELLSLIEQQPQLEFVLIGHRLGAFILKKALLLAYRQKHHEQYISLFEALRTLIMIGEPYLDSEDRTQWSSLVQDSLESTKGSLPETFSVEALTCLKFIEEKFEQLQINSQFFQVSGKPSKRKGLHRTRLKAKNCVCDGSVNVRLWTTQDDDEAVIEGLENNSKCIFSSKSGWRGLLGLITAGEWVKERLPATEENAPLAVADVASTRTESVIMETAPCNPVNHAGATVTACTEAAVPPDVVSQASDKHISVESGNHVSGGHPITENGSRSMMVHQHSVETSPTAPSSVNSDHDLIGGRIDPLSECTDLYTSDIENVDRDMESPSILLRSTTSQSSTSKDLSSPDISHGIFVEAPNIARQRSRPLPLRLSLPPTCGFYFPRKDATTWLERLLFQESSGQGNQALMRNATTVAVLHGTAGVGKTQIALNFARSAQSRFDAVFWLRADSKQSILQSFHDIAIALRLINGRRNYSHTQSAGLVMEWLAKPETQWLLIFDNADEVDIIAPYIPESKNGATVITTRHPELRSPSATSPAFYHVQPLSITDSQSFLQRSTHLKLEDVNTEQGHELLRLLDGLPLALAVISSYIELRRLSIEDFWKIYEQKKKTGGHEASQMPSDASVVNNIWTPPLAKLSPDARRLMAVLSYMDPDAAHTSLVRAVFERTLSPEDSDSVDLRFIEASHDLANLALIDKPEGGTVFTMHRLMQMVTRQYISQNETREIYKALTYVWGTQWPSDRKFPNVLHGFWAEFDDIMNQLWRMTDHVSSSVLSLNALDEYIDESFPRTALGCIWYDRRVRKNNNDYRNLARCAAALIELPKMRLEDSGQPTSKVSYMPRRLVRINHRRQRWKLVDTGGRTLSYLALGLDFNCNEGDPVLTESNLHTFREGVALSQMPKSFRDACVFSGLCLTRYIWIDTLCIDQSNHEETACEVGNIANIYQSAAVTIFPHSQLKLQRNQVNWGRYDVLCGQSSLQKRLWHIQECLIRPNSLKSLASAVGPEVFANIEPYVESNVDAFSCSEFLSMSDTLAPQASGKTQPLLERPTKPSNDITLEPTEESSSSEKPNEDASHEPYAIATAWSCINEGVEDYSHNNKLRAVTKLVRARELIKAPCMASYDALRVDLQAATYLARIFLTDGSAEAAMDLLNNVKVSKEIGESRENNFATIMAQLRIVKGDVFIASGNTSDALNTYRKNIDAIDEDQEGDIADLAAISKLRLSNCNMTQSDWKGAHALIKEVTTHFEEQDSKQGQAQYARALYHQAVLYKGENKEKFRKRSMAAARQALEELCEEHDLDMPATNRELERDDFETVIELGFL